MATQRDPNRQGVMCYVSLDTLAKVRTAISGRKVTIKSAADRKQTSCKRAMGMSDFFIACVEQAVSGIKPSREALAWCREKRQKNEEAHKTNNAMRRSDAEKARQQTFQLRAYYKKRLEAAKEKMREAQKTKGNRQELVILTRRIEELTKRFDACDAACRGYGDRRTKKLSQREIATGR